MSNSIGLTLKTIRLFEGLSPSILNNLEDKCRWQQHDAYNQIIDNGSESADIFFVLEGCVRILNYSLSGKEIILNDVNSGGYFGELSAIDNFPRSASAIALVDCSLAVLGQEAFLTLLRENSSIALRVMQNLSKMVRISTNRIMELSTVAANNRVLFELLRRARENLVSENSANIQPIPRHSEIASRVSTTRETVSRVMNDLARKGIVERKKDSIIVNDIKLLNKIIYQSETN